VFVFWLNNVSYRVIMNEKLMWKEVSVVCFKVLSQNLVEEPRKTMKIFSQDRRLPDLDSKPRTPKYESEVLTATA